MLIIKSIEDFIVFKDDTILQVLKKINNNNREIAFVIDSSGVLEGVVTDGDLRRSMKSDLLNDDVSNIMRNNPILVNSNTLVSAAINIMNKNAITSLIISENKKAIGIVNLKDCLDNE